MSPTDIPSRVKPLAEEILDNDYARENLQEGAEKLRDAYDRSRKRRVKPSRDRKLRKQVESAIKAIDEGTAALASGRRKPSHRGRNMVLGVLAVTAAGTAVALAVNEDLRSSVFGSAKALGDEIGGSDAPSGAGED
jgi:hypothetical protein